MKYLFSLVIPVYNVEQYIEKCLKSCLEQVDISASEYEIILVDDGSPDSSMQVVSEFIKKYSYRNIKQITRKNGGLSAARNTGLEHVEGRYVWFIDSDDWIENNSLSLLKEKIKQNDSVEIITFKHNTVFLNGNISDCPISNDYIGTGFDFLSKNSFLSACCCIYSTEFLKNNKLFFKEGVFWEDSEFNMRAYALSKIHFFFSKPLYYYLRRDNSITNSGALTKMIDSWFVKVDTIYCFFEKIQLETWQINVVNSHLSHTIISAVAGFKDLPGFEKKRFRKKIQSKKKYYWSFFSKSNDVKLKTSGLLILFALPIAENIFWYLTKRAIKKGEGK